jgi:hypothetical protein
VEPGDERVEPLRGVDRLERRQLGQQLLRAAHLVDDAQLVEPLVVLLDAEVADDLQHVPRDPLLGRQTLDRDRPRLGGGPLHQVACPRTPHRRGVLEPVGVARVTVERRGRRVELEDAFPETVGEVVHGRRHIGHGGLSERNRVGRR